MAEESDTRNVWVDIIPQNGDDVRVAMTPAEAVLLRGLRIFELPTGRAMNPTRFCVHEFDVTLVTPPDKPPIFGVTIRGRYVE